MAGGLMLGPVMFQAFEVPERLRFGGRQRLSVHQLPGGGRVVDAMGPDEGPLSWSGVFSGPNAASRVRLLEGLRRDGLPLLLAWAGWRYTVLIETFEAEAMNPAWIPYKVRTCVVAVGDLPAAELLPAPATVLDAEALGAGPDLADAIEQATSQLGSDDVVTAIDASGRLAQLVAARAFLAAAGGSVA